MRKYFLIHFLIISFVFVSTPIIHAAKAPRGIVVVPIKDKQGKRVCLYKESHALVIGASNYTEGWPKLPGVKKDIKLVSAILEEHGFDVAKVTNPNKEQLRKAFEDFINKYGRKPENRLLFYFAGHGYTLKQSYGEEMGYIIPVDAPNPNRDLDGFMGKAIDMQLIEVFAKRIQSKHALFLFDSCFSGSIFALTRAIPENISYKTSKPVRQFITSGSAEELVPDISTFRQQFISALEGEGDMDKDGYVTGTELGEFLQSKVVNYTKGAQHPQYGKIRNPNLDRGDFVFVVGSGIYEPPQEQLPSKPEEVVDPSLIKYPKGTIDKLSTYPKHEPVIRPEIPTIMVVTRGEPDVSAIVESIIEKKLHESSFPVSGVEEMLSILGGYGRYEIPLHALQKHKLNANILVYVIVDPTGIEPLEFYGKIMYQYSSTITIKLIDTATKNMVCPTITSSARYTTFNMQDNIQEVTEQIAANIPKKIEGFWNK